MRLFSMFVVITILLCGCSSTSTSPGGGGAQDTEGPKAVVTAYMDALKTPDYIKALELAGLTIPKQAADQVQPILQTQKYFNWKVTAYTIKDVKVDGGLAQVTVEETASREADQMVKASLAQAGEVGNAIKFGEVKTTETFVLVRLNGKWVFDTSHSGIPFNNLPIDELAAMKGPPSPEMQKKIAEFINGIGLGQAVQSLSSPVLPLAAGIAVPNFLRARTQGQVTACKSNLKNIGTGLEMWSTDNQGHFPSKLDELTPNYLRHIPSCPTAGSDTYSSSFVSSNEPPGYTVVCTGTNHSDVNFSANYPQYTSTQGLLER